MSCYTNVIFIFLVGYLMIIHFTKKFEFLNSILHSKSFRLKYCCEYIGDEKGKIVSNAAHPMVSFSEFNDNDLKNKPITYGRYGIALKKRLG